MADDDIKPGAEGQGADAQDAPDAFSTDSSDFVADGADAGDQAEQPRASDSDPADAGPDAASEVSPDMYHVLSVVKDHTIVWYFHSDIRQHFECSNSLFQLMTHSNWGGNLKQKQSQASLSSWDNQLTVQW